MNTKRQDRVWNWKSFWPIKWLIHWVMSNDRVLFRPLMLLLNNHQSWQNFDNIFKRYQLKLGKFKVSISYAIKSYFENIPVGERSNSKLTALKPFLWKRTQRVQNETFNNLLSWWHFWWIKCLMSHHLHYPS